MFYCGLDIAMKSSYLYLTDWQGKKLASAELPTEKAALAQRLKPYLRGGLRLAMEAGSQSVWIHDALVERGGPVTAVHPAKVQRIAESRQKTDKIDAKILCELLRLDGLPHPVHVPPAQTRALRGVLVARRLVRLTMRDGEGLELPATLRLEGAEAGRLTSMMPHPLEPRWVGLGYLKTGVQEPATLEAGDPPRAVCVLIS